MAQNKNVQKITEGDSVMLAVRVGHVPGDNPRNFSLTQLYHTEERRPEFVTVNFPHISCSSKDQISPAARIERRPVQEPRDESQSVLWWREHVTTDLLAISKGNV